MNHLATRTLSAAALAFFGLAGGALWAQQPDRATIGAGGSIEFGTTREGGASAGMTEADPPRRAAPGATRIRPRGFDPYASYRPHWRHGYWGSRSLAYGYPEFQRFGSPNGIFLWPGYRDFVGGGYHASGPNAMLSSMFSRWGYGSWLYRAGFVPYTNPYYAADLLGPGQSTPYDYNLPIDTTGEPREEAKARPALQLFDSAREAFKRGDYNEAGRQVDQALKLLPDDATLHEFRALCLFAVGRYDEAAAALYAVIAVSPGWDWPTLIGLYPNIDAYTRQLRALETYAKSHESAHAWFVLGCHYLSQGALDAAETALARATRLNPRDDISAKLLGRLAAAKTETGAEPVARAEAPAASAPPEGASIVGAWTAEPAAGGKVSLTIKDDGSFAWGVTRDGRTQTLAGKSTFEKDLLVLAPHEGPPLIGRVSWANPTHMTFHLIGDGPDDPGLSFAR